MLALSGDSTNADHSSSGGNPIDVEWRRAMDDLRQQEEDEMMRGTYSKSCNTFFCLNNFSCPLGILNTIIILSQRVII